MQQVSVIGFDGALSSAITGIIDLFQLAGVSWARIHGQSPEPYFQARLLTEHGEPCRCINGVTISAHGSWREAGLRSGNSLVVVPTIGRPIGKALEDNAALVGWLSSFAGTSTGGVQVASNCTGAFLLAEAGLLDGREATTHWGFSQQFRQRYPQVTLQPEKLVTVDGPVACAGGGVAWWDLGVYLVENFAGPEVARELARAFVIDIGRTSQAPYSVLQSRRYHSDKAVLRVQDWIEEHFPESLSLANMAAKAGLTERTLFRRFRSATGDSPATYLQLVRIEHARQALAASADSLESIVRSVGYEDLSSFSRLFRKHTGMTPGAWRARFAH